MSVPGSFVAGDILNAAEMNALGGGVKGYAQVIADQTGIASSITDITSLTVTFTAVANRLYKLSANLIFTQLTSTGTLTGFFREGSTELGRFFRMNNVVANQINPASGWCYVAAPSAGAHTYKLSASTSAGTVTVTAAATFPAQLMVEDCGPS